jgi:hypothetical protein
MRHLLATVAVLAVAAPAAAQPVTRPEMRAEMCGVTFVRAPDAVRYVIEQWLAAEPHCSAAIELRVVPTDGGLYLLAQRPDGRIHERLVPDAQSAGVLVASWVADDWTAPPAAPSSPVTVEVDPFRMGAPGSVGVAALAPAHKPAGPGHWLSLGMIVQTDNEGGGFRGEAEIASLGAWKLGGIVSYSESNYDLMQQTTFDWGVLTVNDLEAMAYLSRAVSFGRWELRGGIGLGAIHTTANVFGTTAYQPGTQPGNAAYQADKTFPVGEVSAMLTRRIGDSWGLGIGPVVTWIDETFTSTDPNVTSATVERRMPQLMVFGGLRYEL